MTLITRLLTTGALCVGIAAAQPIVSGQSQSGPPQVETSTYEGPTIMSRDRSLIGERGGKLLDYNYYGSITATYDTALVPVSTTSSGQLAPAGNAIGLEAGWGLTGTRTWRHDKLSLDYIGAAHHYANNSYYDGVDQFLNLLYFHQFSRRWSIQTRETAGTTSQGTGFYTYLPLSNTDLYAVPTNELFDNRTDFVQSRVDLTWYKSPRLSFNFGGEGFYTHRRSAALASFDGYNAHGDITYRLTRRQNATVSYEYTAFAYQRQYGDANIGQLALGWGIGLGRRWDFTAQGGAARVDFNGLAIINVDPAIAAIIGRNTAIVTFHRISYIPIFGAQLTRRFEKSAVTAAFNSTYSPGNGVYLTSRQEAAALNYSYVGLRRLTLGASLGYNRLSSLGQTLGIYSGYQGGVGGTYRLAGYAHFEFRYDYRRYNTGSAGYRADSSRVSAGLAFSPASRPLAIW